MQIMKILDLYVKILKLAKYIDRTKTCCDRPTPCLFVDNFPKLLSVSQIPLHISLYKVSVNFTFLMDLPGFFVTLSYEKGKAYCLKSLWSLFFFFIGVKGHQMLGFSCAHNICEYMF